MDGMKFEKDEATGGMALRVPEQAGVTQGAVLANVRVAPWLRHGMTAHQFSRPHMPDCFDQGETALDVSDRLKAITDSSDLVAELTSYLTAQAITLDTVATSLLNRAGLNMGDHLHATDTYMKLALKAQAQSRQTIETLARILNGGEQVVKHVHVNGSGQAIVADQFHHHTGGPNAQIDGQPHATVAALPSQDAGGDALPVASDTREKAVSNARRGKSGRA